MDQTKAAPDWGPARRLLFRFAFAYLFLYIFPFPLNLFSETPTKPYDALWRAIVPWVGELAFGQEITVFPNGSGDTTYNYVQVLCFLVLAGIAAGVWSLLDRKRAEYTRLSDWLRVYVRFFLAAMMVSYGAYKVIPSQFPSLTLDRLVQTFGEASPMGLLWTFMGASVSYNIFTGLSEMIAGLLLIARRTALLGALLCIGVMSNVVMLNFSYDVPVKLLSSHLLAMSLFLTLPHLRRLGNFFLFNRPVEPAEIRPLFERKPFHTGALAFRGALIVGFAVFSLNQSYSYFRQREPETRPPLHGVWEVDEIVVGGKEQPPLVKDPTRWRRLIFERPGIAVIQFTGNPMRGYRVQLDPQKRTLGLSRRDEKVKHVFSYQQPNPQILVLAGAFEEKEVQARLRRVDPSQFLLTSRGFHWINEYPLNQ